MTGKTKAKEKPKTLRCAIYTRKSSDEGLEQSFNSLHAQREACEAYIKSQAHEGWICLPTVYDDGGFSGGNMDRPALKALMADVATGKIDVIVVYKIDRLTRSLMDFSKIVEVFDTAGASFVSITQAFNTTTSMGRLTLNVLLSFAQFEREVTGERIRDKIAQSKAKGMWMGGNVLLGYDLKNRELVINPEEAALVVSLFERYLTVGSVHRLKDQLELENLRTKQWTSLNGRPLGGKLFGRGTLYHLLRNRHYRGEIVHKGTVHAGKHQPIVSADLFDQVQVTLNANRHDQNHRNQTTRIARETLFRLTGKIHDAEGDIMSPTVSFGRSGHRYRYYVSSCLQNGVAVASAPSLAPRRIAATAIEEFVADELKRLMDRPGADWNDLSSVLLQVKVRPATTELLLDAAVLFGDQHHELALSALRRKLRPGEEAVVETDDPSLVRISLPVRLKFRGGRNGLVSDPRPQTLPRGSMDPTLIKGLRTAHALLADHCLSPLAPLLSVQAGDAPGTAYERRLSRLAFLAPDLQDAILEGRQPEKLTVQRFIKDDLPLDWEGQRRWWRAMR